MSGGLLDSALRASVVLVPALAFTLGSRRSSAAVRHAVCFLGILAAVAMPALALIVPDLEFAVLPAANPVAGSAAGGASPAWLGPVLAAVWLLGATVVFNRVLSGVSRARALCRRATLVSDARVLSAVIRVRRELGLDMPIRVLSQRSLSAPLTWGLVRPVVLLPRGARNWSRGRLRAVLLHELSHARRRDCLTQLVADFACAVYWFHPLVWLAARRMRVERERACDDTVVVVGGRPSGYAVLLLRMVKGIHGGAIPLRPGATAMFADGGGLAGRLRALLGRARDRRSLSPAAVTAFAFGVISIALPAAAVRLTHRAPVAPPPTAVRAEAAPSPEAETLTARNPDPAPAAVPHPTPAPSPAAGLPVARTPVPLPLPPAAGHSEPRSPTPRMVQELERKLTHLAGRPVKVRRIDSERPLRPKVPVWFSAGFTFYLELGRTPDRDK